MARATFVQPHAPHGNPGCEHRRLGFIRLVQFLGRAFLRQCPQVVTKHITGFLECIDNHGMLFGEFCQHADRLGTLAGKDHAER